MTQTVLGPKGSQRRRWSVLVTLAVAVCFGLMWVAGAQAVHETDFQLDGETTNMAYSSPGTSSPDTDWNDIFNADGTKTSAVNPSNNPGFTHATFIRDFGVKVSAQDNCSLTNTSSTTFCTADTTTFATGSKDTLDITPGWQCNKDNNVNSKIDIMNAYSVAYKDSSGDSILYFGLEKNKDNGVNDVGFWFLQGNANCTVGGGGGGTPWTGTHANGDILVVSEFSNGGGVSNVTAYKWNNGALAPFGVGGDCKSIAGSDSLCATTNAAGGPQWNSPVTTKWLSADATNGVGKTDIVASPDFFEGGINISQLFEENAEAPPSCFNTFIADTRSSKETGATLFDYARGTLGQCSATVTTTPSLTSTTLGSNDPITDLADVHGTTAAGTAPKPTGEISFSLCGPLASAAGCATGGTAVAGNPKTLGNCNPDLAGHSCATSGNARPLVTSGGPGWYCFRAVYDPKTDTNYQSSAGALDGSTSECFNVTATASTSTAQSWVPNDTATITADGGATVAGTVDFILYVGSATCSTGTGVTTVPFNDRPVTFNTTTKQGTATTNNTTAYTANTVISWRATFESSNSVSSGTASHCETSTLTVNNDIGS
jgi:hypothetical protein